MSIIECADSLLYGNDNKIVALALCVSFNFGHQLLQLSSTQLPVPESSSTPLWMQFTLGFIQLSCSCLCRLLCLYLPYQLPGPLQVLLPHLQ